MAHLHTISDTDQYTSLAPRRQASLLGRPRPMTSCGPVNTSQTFPRPQLNRHSFVANTSYDVLDWQSFSRDQEQEPEPLVTPTLSEAFSNLSWGGSFKPVLHRNRKTALGESLRNSILEIRSLGRRVSINVKNKASRQREEQQQQQQPPPTVDENNNNNISKQRSNLLSFKTGQQMMDLTEACSSRPKSRGWLFRNPSTRRRPSLPLLNFVSDPGPMKDSPIDQIPPRSRGVPVLSDLVYGGAGARAAAAAQNELFQASTSPSLPPYDEISKANPKEGEDSESGIGIMVDAGSRRDSTGAVAHVVRCDPTSVLAAELLEGVFCYLDINSLLSAGLVSRKWRSLCQSQTVWRNIFYRDFDARDRSRSGVSNSAPGLGKRNPTQDFQKLSKVRTLIEKRWQNGEAAAIYLNGHKDSVYCVQFDEDKIITGSRDNTIRVWDARTYQCIRKLGPNENPRERLHLERASVEPQGVLPFFRADVSSPDPISPPLAQWHQASVLCLQYDEELLATGSSDFTCLVWSIKDNYKPLFRLLGHQAGVLDVCLSKDQIITCSKDTTIKIWNRRNGRLIRTLMGHRGPVNAVQVRGNLLASASGDGMSKLWRLEDGMCIKEFRAKDRGLACVEFSEDGRTIFAGGNDQAIYEYDTLTGNRIRELRGHRDLVRSLHLDSAGSRIISGSYDHSVKVWDAKRGESADDGGLKINFEGWTSSWMLAAKSNYRKIVCTSQDGRVLIIDFGYGIEGVELVEG